MNLCKVQGTLLMDHFDEKFHTNLTKTFLELHYNRTFFIPNYFPSFLTTYRFILLSEISFSNFSWLFAFILHRLSPTTPQIVSPYSPSWHLLSYHYHIITSGTGNLRKQMERFSSGAAYSLPRRQRMHPPMWCMGHAESLEESDGPMTKDFINDDLGKMNRKIVLVQHTDIW